MDIASFPALKLAIVNLTGLSKDALHVHVGLAIFFLSGALLRKPPHAWAPLGIILALAALGELLDRRDNILDIGYWLWDDSLHDMLNTLFWPSVIFALARWRMAFGPRAH